MTTDRAMLAQELLPLPEPKLRTIREATDWSARCVVHSYDQLQLIDYARACVAAAIKGAGVGELRAENQRLRTAVAENISSATMLREMNIIDGGLNIGLEGGSAQLLAESFAEQFVDSGAVNFLELTFTSAKVGKLTVTMQKAGALTPADKTRNAEARAERLAEALRLIAAEQSATSATDAADRFQSIAKAALAASSADGEGSAKWECGHCKRPFGIDGCNCYTPKSKEAAPEG